MALNRLAEIGRITTARLARNPVVQPVTGEGVDLYCVQNFLTIEECGGLIAMIDSGRKPSGLLSATDDPDFRTSESCDLDRWHPFVQGIDLRISDLLAIDPRRGETMQGQRYAVGQQFKGHHDYFHVSEIYWQTEKKRGGQRSWTAMIYLDEPEGGGETLFSAAGLKVTPRTAMLLAWNNMDKKGAPNAQALHESLPVIAGQKNVVTKWYRERFWV